MAGGKNGVTKPVDPDRMLKAALRYAAIGWKIFPLRSKTHPTIPRLDTKTPHQMLGRAEKGQPSGHLLATTDATQIRAWWARDPQANIGLWLAGSGLVAIDIDPREGGDKTMAKLEALHAPARSPVTAITGRRDGGEHRIFAAWAEMPDPPGELGKKIGGGIQLKYNGYIVVAPSVHPATGRRYAWRKGKSPWDGAWLMPRLPAWCLARDMPSALTGPPGPVAVDPEDVFASDAQRTDITLDELRRALMMVPNGGGDDGEEQTYDVWLQVGMALYHQTDGSEEGRALWEAWSEQSSKHSDAELNRKWLSLDARGKGRAPITARYVLGLAKPYRDAIVAERLLTAKEEVQAAPTFAALKAACDRVKTLDIEPAIRESLAVLVKTAFQRIEGTPLPIAECRRLIREEREVETVASIEAAAEEEESAPKLPPWLNGVCYIESEDRFYNWRTGSLLTGLAFDRAHARVLLTEQERREGKTVPAVQPSDVALNRWRIPSVDSRVYLPREPRFFTMEGRKRVNTYSEHGVPKAKPESEWTARERQDVALVDRHFSVLLPDARDSALLRSWCAYVVQTLRRVGFSALVQSVEGAGKTFLAQMMAAVLGSRHVGTVTASEVESEFTGWAEGRLVVAVEEMRMRGHSRFDGLNRIKPFITNETIPVRRMRQDIVNAVNTANYLIFTNFRDALPIDERDRRHMVLFSQFQTKAQIGKFIAEEPNYYNRLFRTIERSPEAIKGWLKGYKLHPDFKAGGHAPATSGKAEMIALSKPDEQVRIEEVLRESRSATLSAALLKWDDLMGALGADLQELPSPKAVARILTDMGFASLGRLRVDGGERASFWSQTPERFRRAGVVDGRLVRDYLDEEEL